MPPSLPLPRDYFICPPLADADVDQLLDLATVSAMNLVSKARLRGGWVSWTLLADEADAKIYKAIDDSNGSTLHCGTAQLVGTIEEVAALFKSETTEDAKEHCRRFGYGYLDAVVLYNIKPWSPKTPLEKVGVLWRAFASPGGKLVQSRDACGIEVHREFMIGGRRGWVCALTSLELQCCPDLEQKLGLVRMQNYGSGHVVVESETRPGYLDITYVSHVEVNRGKSEWVVDVIRQKGWITDVSIKNRCRNVSKIDRLLRENRLSQARLLREDELVPATACRKCFLCQSNFGPWKKRWNCLKCGQVICTGCSRSWEIVHGVGELQSRKLCRFCTICSLAPQITLAADAKKVAGTSEVDRRRGGKWLPVRERSPKLVKNW